MSEPLIQTPGVFGENDNFLLERELGSGGMGGVYMGRDKMLDRPVAVKVMLKEYGDDAEFVEKFKKEAQSAARLIHPNIAQVYSYGICKGLPYIAMELAAGGSLFTLMNANRGKTDVARVLKVCQQVAQALQCASDQGCVHGDVKPENILFDANGNAKLVDFGLAAMQKETSEIWGTPYYISPEKVKKEPVDFRSDMYSLGGTLYHALTGVAPVEGDDPIAVVKKRFEATPKKPSEIRPDLTPAIDALVMKMLALDKANRYPSFEALLEAFKNVLTTGLTAAAQKQPSAPAAGSKKKTLAAGPRRLTTAHGARRLATPKRPMPVKAPEPNDEEEESGGNLGMKVVGAVVGGILLIGAVIGGLVWYQVADKKARAADEASQIATGIQKAREAISEALNGAVKFADDFEVFAAGAITACEKPTAELKKILPEAQGAMLKPGPSKELLDAIAATNDVPPAAETPKDEKKPATTNVVTKAASTNEVAAATNAVETAAATNAAPAAVEIPQVVLDINELWNRAYTCQACAIRIRHKARQLLKKGAEADAIKGTTQTDMENLANLSRDLVDGFEQIKTSKDVETVRKGIGFIKAKGEKTVAQTVKQIRLDNLKAEREAKKAAEAAAEEARKKKQEEERKAKVEAETGAVKEKFDAIVAQGCLRQLDWKSALRMLNALKDTLATPEGQLAVDLQIRKVNDMKAVQDIFLKNLKGYVFKGKLRTCQVEEANEKELVLYKPGKQGKIKIPWQKFYSSYPGNLNEIINTYIVNAHNPGAKVRIASLLEWANAMTGAALTMHLVCGEVNGAVERGNELMRKVVAQFPDYEKTAKDIFPDMSFDEEAAAKGDSEEEDDEEEEE